MLLFQPFLDINGYWYLSEIVPDIIREAAFSKFNIPSHDMLDFKMRCHRFPHCIRILYGLEAEDDRNFLLVLDVVRLFGIR